MLRVPAIFRRALLTPALAALLVLAAGSAQATPAGPTATLGRSRRRHDHVRFEDRRPRAGGSPSSRMGGSSRPATAREVRGPVGSSFALLRYRPDGTLDSTFGLDGKVMTDFGAGGSTAQAVAVQPDGKIVAAGETVVSRPDFDIALARYNADGALDAGFGSGGKVTATFGPTSDFAGAVAVQPDGKIVLAGASGVSSTAGRGLRPRSLQARRLARFGLRKRRNGHDAVRAPRRRSRARARPPAGREDRRVGSELVGSREGPSDFALARYTPEGVLDPTFGSGGKVTTHLRQRERLRQRRRPPARREDRRRGLQLPGQGRPVRVRARSVHARRLARSELRRGREGDDGCRA